MRKVSELNDDMRLKPYPRLRQSPARIHLFGMDDLLDLPSSVNGWNSEIASRQLTGKSILDLRSYDSGSKIKQEQFLLLRAYYVVLKRDEFSSHHRARWFPYYDKAKDILNSEEAAGLGWQQYLDSFDDPAFKKPLPKFPNLGSFSLVRYYQRAVENVNSSHVSQKTRYFTRSVSKSSETRREELQTPIRSSSRHLPADLNERMGDLTLNTPGSTMSPYDASDATEMAKLLVPTEDEQIVNTALIIFLTTITMHFTNKVHWSLERKAFQVCAGMDKMFEARVDGILRSGNGENDDVLAIMEVKPCMRLLNRVNIRMQETAQMACWISSQSDSSLLSQTSGKYGRHKCVSPL